MTDYKDWLNIQNGGKPSSTLTFETNPVYIRNGRDLARWVQLDFPYMAQLNAGLILLGFGPQALQSSNPYLNSKTQAGFVTFGGPHVLDFAAKAARLALEAAWYQKWLCHRLLRPEEFGGLVQNTKTGKVDYPISCELLQSEAVKLTHDQYGTYLLSQAYPDGCPAHPTYPAGHACFVGAGVTILKAFFDEAFIIPTPVEASADGQSLKAYEGPPLTVGGELNKLASNVCIGRDWAGIHYRFDGMEGIRLGEAIAIDMLQNYCDTYNENFTGYTLTTFDGVKVEIGCKCK